MHLLYRLQHGQVYKKHQPKLATVMIGTNDLGAASCLGGESAILQSAAGTLDRSALFPDGSMVWYLSTLVKLLHAYALMSADKLASATPAATSC